MADTQASRSSTLSASNTRRICRFSTI
jgi:hypothetical protein